MAYHDNITRRVDDVRIELIEYCKTSTNCDKVNVHKLSHPTTYSKNEFYTISNLSYLRKLLVRNFYIK